MPDVLPHHFNDIEIDVPGQVGDQMSQHRLALWVGLELYVERYLITYWQWGRSFAEYIKIPTNVLKVVASPEGRSSAGGSISSCGCSSAYFRTCTASTSIIGIPHGCGGDTVLLHVILCPKAA
jgi:hypothetical protein